MVNPVTVNVGLIVPLTGADVDTWGENDVNPSMVAIDALFGGVQTISVTTGTVTLTKPAALTPTPSPGPTQSQNCALIFTGALVGDVIVKLPLPGRYIVENQTTGNFLFQLDSTSASPTRQSIAIPQGSCHTIYSDGVNVRFVDLGKVGDMEFWAGITSMPSWVNACTVKPYVLCDGVVRNFSDFPYLGARLLGSFGGNGITTFAPPDMAGRVPLAYDSTGARITVAGCGINGQTLGASLDKQTNVLVTGNLPPYTPSGTVSSVLGGTFTNGIAITGGSAPPATTVGGSASGGQVGAISVTSTFTGAPQNGNSTPVNNVQPGQVAGIWVVKT